MPEQPWHGAHKDEIEGGRVTAPPKPEAFRETAAPQGAGGADTWKRVVFSGNYGFPGCTQFQEHTYYNISEQEISQIAWTLFGMCPNWQARRYNS